MKVRVLGLMVIFGAIALGVLIGMSVVKPEIRTVYVQPSPVISPVSSVSASPSLSPVLKKVIVSPTKKVLPTVPFTLSPTR